jgi:hypothetical protein
MPNATVLANAQALPQTDRDAAIIERVNRRYNQPDLYEKGLEILEILEKSLDAPTPDPIFESIDAHSQAWALFAEIDAMEPCDEQLRRRAEQVSKKALRRLLATPPTTLAGMRAMIEYLHKWDEDSEPQNSWEYLKTLLRSPIFALEEAHT